MDSSAQSKALEGFDSLEEAITEAIPAADATKLATV